MLVLTYIFYLPNLPTNPPLRFVFVLASPSPTFLHFNIYDDDELIHSASSLRLPHRSSRSIHLQVSCCCSSSSILSMGVQQINVHSRLTVVPHKPTPPKKLHPLSYLDHLLKLHTVKTVFYYNTSSVQDRSKLLDRLKDSLCRALSIYPLFAGRLQKRDEGTWEVKCNDAGVRIYEAKCATSLQEFFTQCRTDHLLESELGRTELNADHTITPVAVIQFTEFSCGNIAIGLSWTHGIGDPLCGILFMKAWGETYRAAQILHPPFFHPPSLKPRDKANLEVRSRDYYANSFFNDRKGDEDVPGKQFGTVSLSFSSDAVEQLIEEVKNGNFKYGPPSPSDVISALLWTAVLRAQGRSEIDEAKLSLCLEFRKIHLPPLPYGYVGNAVHFAGITCKVGELFSQDLSYPASLINENSGMVDTEEVRSVIDLVNELETQGKEMRQKPPLLYSDGLTIAVFDHFMCYDVIFDFGKPVKVECKIEPFQGEGQLIVMPGPEGKSSRIVMVSLPEEDMVKLFQDTEISRFLPDLQAYRTQ